MNFVVLCSSNGTTFQAVLDCIADGSLTAKCLGLITDQHDRGCIAKAKKAGISVTIVKHKPNESRETYDKRIYETIQNTTHYQLQTTNYFLACMGWIHIFSPWFVTQFPGRILNVHPALLPKYGGKGMYGITVHEEVLRHKEKESGMTIHIVTDEVDQGHILLQKKCPVLPTDTPATLQKRVQELEKEWYPKVLKMLHSPPPTGEG